MPTTEYADTRRRANLQDPEARLAWLLEEREGARSDNAAVLDQLIARTERRLTRPPETRRSPMPSLPATNPAAARILARAHQVAAELDQMPTAFDLQLRSLHGKNEREMLEQMLADWREIGRRFFKKLPYNPIIRLDRPANPRSMGNCGHTLEGQPVVSIDPAVLVGDAVISQGGNRDPEGLRRFAFDLLLHEAIHANAFAWLGEQAFARGHHGGNFHADCLRICQFSGFEVEKRWREKLTLDNCQYFPDPIRPKGWYRGAVQEW
jgi:hypothetical protein